MQDRPVHSTEPNSTFQQQQTALYINNIDVNPRQKFLIDLAAEMRSWISNGEIYLRWVISTTTLEEMW